MGKVGAPFGNKNGLIWTLDKANELLDKAIELTNRKELVIVDKQEVQAYEFDFIGEIARDENLHVAITQNIIKNWKKHPEEGFQDILKKNEDRIYEMYRIAATNEKNWSSYLFSKGSLLGLNEEIMHQYIEWLTNVRLTGIGLKKIFDQSKNPVSGWSDRYFDSSKVQVAPQETEVESYLVGSANTSIKNEDFDSITL